MDATRIDALTRALTAPGPRRRALAAVLGGSWILLGWQRRDDATAHNALTACKKKSGKKKKCLKKAKKHNATHTTQAPPVPPPGPCAGVSCGAVPHGETTCSNGVCVITACDAGFINCSGNAADGCDCETPRCCGGACESIHSNGLEQTFIDCVPLGTYDETQARKAAGAWAAVNTEGTTSLQTAACPCGNNSFCGANFHELAPAGGTCAVWTFSGPLAGRVIERFDGCRCPQSINASWT